MLLLGPLGWREQEAVAAWPLCHSGHHRWRRKAELRGPQAASLQRDLSPALVLGTACTPGGQPGEQKPPSSLRSPRRPGPCRACLQHARNIAGVVTGLKIASQQSATAFPKSHVVQVRGLIGNAYFDLQSDWIFPGHFERKNV